MKLHRILILVLLVPLIFSCDFLGTKPITPEWKKGSVTEPGWNIFPTPRTANAPGTLIRIDVDGVMYVIADLSELMVVETSETSIPNLVVDSQRGLGFLASLLSENKAFREIASAEVNWDRNKKAKFSFKLDDPVQNEELIENPLAPPTGKLSVEQAIAKYLAETGFVPNDSDKYYLIKGTRSSKTVDFTLSQETTGSFGGKAQVEKIADVESKVSQNDSKSLELKKSWDKPFRILYKADSVSFTKGAAGVAKVESVSPVGVVDWSKEQ